MGKKKTSAKKKDAPKKKRQENAAEEFKRCIEKEKNAHSCYKQLAMKYHPDKGGKTEDFQDLQNAFDEEGKASAKKKDAPKKAQKASAKKKDCTLDHIQSTLSEMKDEEQSIETMLAFIKSCDCVNYDHDTMQSEHTRAALIQLWKMGEEPTSRKDGTLCRKKRRRKERPDETIARGQILQLFLGGLGGGKLDKRKQKEAIKVIDAVAAEEEDGLLRFKRKAYAFLSDIWAVTKTGASIVRKFVSENPRIALTTICGMLLVSVIGVDRFAQLISALLGFIKLIYSGVSGASGILSKIVDLFSGTTQQAEVVLSTIGKAGASEEQMEGLRAVVRSDPNDKKAILDAFNMTKEYAKQIHETNRLNAKVGIKNNYDVNMGTANIAVAAPLAFQAVAYGLAVLAPPVGVPVAMVSNVIRVMSVANAVVSFSGAAYGAMTQASHNVAVRGL